MIETRRTTFTRLEIALSGIVDANDVRRAVAELEAALDGEAGGATLLVDLGGAEDVAMKAGAELARAGALLPRLGRLRRVAVLGDASWTATLARLQAALPARLEVRFFDAAEADAARAWIGAAGATGDGADARVGGGAARGYGRIADGDRSTPDGSGPGTAGPDGTGPGGAGPDGTGSGDAARGEGAPGGAPRDAPGFRLLDDGAGLHVLEIEGRIRRADVEAVAARLDEVGAGAERVRILGRVRRFDGFEPAVMLSPALWRLQREGLARVSRFALVTSVEWLGRLLESTGRLQGVEVRTFAADDEAGARAWLGASPPG